MNLNNLRNTNIPKAAKIITGLIAFIILLCITLSSFYQIESGTRGLVFTNGSLNAVADAILIQRNAHLIKEIKNHY